jgi:DNA-directed RNA polymerase specialized sigma24 family protein
VDDLWQDTLVSLLRALRGGTVKMGRPLTPYVIRAYKNKLITDRTRPGPVPVADDAFDGVQGRDDMDAKWERDHAIYIAAKCLRAAKRHFRPEIYQMFCMRVIDKRTYREIASVFGKSVSAVYLDIFRVRVFIRAMRRRIERSQ